MNYKTSDFSPSLAMSANVSAYHKL